MFLVESIAKEMQVHSILPLLRGNKEGWPKEVFVQISESEVGGADGIRRWKYGVIAHDEDPWKDAGSERYVEQYLSDLEADPCELSNLVGMRSHQEVAGIMRNRLARRMVEASEDESAIESSKERPAGYAEQLNMPSGEANA